MPSVIPLRPDEPRRIGRYRLTGRFEDPGVAGEGSVGAYTATRADGETVTVTLLGEGRAADAAARDRFTAEARAARRVPPFSMARIFDAGFDGPRPYLVSEFVPGPSLAEAVAAGGALPEDAVRGVAAGTVTALAAIHRAGLVHGNLCPDTVVLGAAGPRVVHFSITPPYGLATPAADMLAWARTVLFAAAGARPPRRPGIPDALPVTAAVYGQRDLALLPADLRGVVAGCLSPDPAGRPTARAVLAELLSGHPAPAGLLAAGSRLAQAAARAPLPTRPQPPRGPPRRRMAAILWAAACAVCVLAIIAAVVYIARRHGPASAGSGVSSSTAGVRRSPHIPLAMAGQWSGVIRQAHPVLSVTVHLSLAAAAGKAGGSVAYPALGCSGGLTVVSAAPGRLVLHQAIATGRNNCESGTVTLTQAPGGKLTFTFGRPGSGSPTGTLTRQ